MPKTRLSAHELFDQVNNTIRSEPSTRRFAAAAWAVRVIPQTRPATSDAPNWRLDPSTVEPEAAAALAAAEREVQAQFDLATPPLGSSAMR